MRVLVACEESQRVCKAFRDRGHEAYSCDILEPTGGHPEWHIQGDVLPILDGFCFVDTMDGRQHVIPDRWDMIIAFPPCTDLAVSGARHFAKKREDGRQQRAIDFFMEFVNCDCVRVAIENPVGIMSSVYRKPDQYIQPYEYGHPISKKTCLWLKGLPRLIPENRVMPLKADRHGFTIGGALRYATDENGKILSWKDPRTARERSKTFEGVALAMARQWG